MRFKKLLPSYFIPVFRRVEKRIRFVVSSLILTGLMILSTLFLFDQAILFIPLLVFAAYVLTYLSILEGIQKAEKFMLFIMPVAFTVAFYVFYFLFPVRWLTRVPFIAIYGFSIYAILLTSNIFNVGVERSIQLYRAAFSVNYFYQTLLVFLIFNIVLSFKQQFFINGLVSFLFLLPLACQILWSVHPKISFDRKIFQYSFFVSFIVAELTIVLSFMPIKGTVIALFLTATYYSLVGLMYHFIDERLFKQTVREYIFVLIFVTAILLLSIQW